MKSAPNPAPERRTDAPALAPQTPNAADPGLASLLTAIFEAWNQAGIHFLVLRNYEHLPAATSNDVDVLVAAAQFGQAEQWMRAAAQQCGYRLHNRVEFATVSFFFHHPASLRQIQIDLFSALKWHSFEMLPADAVLAARRARGLFATPDPGHEAVINLLTRLLYQGQVMEKYKPIIVAGFNAAPEQARALLTQGCGPQWAAKLLELVRAEQWAQIEQLWTPVRTALIRRRLCRDFGATIRSLARDLGRGVRRGLQPPGLTVVLLGADGSGKSTLGQKLIEQLRHTFNPGKGLLVHWKPVVFFPARRQPSGTPVVNPHGQKPRHPLASLLYLVGHGLEYFLGTLLQFRPVLFKNGLVLIDRYFYDFLVDRRRYRLQVPDRLVRWMIRLLKKPDLVFLLDAPAQVLQARKAEVSLEETARQVAAYRALVAGLPQGQILDATQPPDLMAAAAVRRVLDFMAQRAQQRFNLNSAVKIATQRRNKPSAAEPQPK